jgi:hypothetical protein
VPGFFCWILGDAIFSGVCKWLKEERVNSPVKSKEMGGGLKVCTHYSQRNPQENIEVRWARVVVRPIQLYQVYIRYASLQLDST